jgi:hypothetical protein
MTISVHSLQAAHSDTQTQQSVQPPKNLQSQPPEHITNSQDVVTISHDARRALASNTKLASGSDPNPNGNNH